MTNNILDKSLPKTPLYQWFYDGRKTRKLIEWLSKINEGDIGDIDLNNPELEAILATLQGKIKGVEEKLDALPNFQLLINRIISLETTDETYASEIQGILGKLNGILERLAVIEDREPTDPESPITPDEITSILEKIDELDNKYSELETLTESVNIRIMTNEQILEAITIN